MSKLIVMYQKPSDPGHFAAYFRETHMPLVQKMPGLRSSVYGPTSNLDGSDSALFWMFVGTFDSREAITQALGSPQGQATIADIPNYASIAPTILYLDDARS